MRILFCNFEYPPLGGGGGVINALLARELAGRHDVTVLTSRASGLPAVEQSDGVEVVRVPVLARDNAAAASMLSMGCYLPMGILSAAGPLRKRQFDIINTHFVVPTGPVGHALAGLWKIPNVLTVHGGDLFDPSKASSPHRHAWLRTAIRYLLRRADLVVGQSANTLANIETYYTTGIPSRLIPLGIERPADCTESRAELDLDEQAFVMVTVGRLVARKAIDQLIAMLPALPDKVMLVVIGDGPLLAELRAQGESLGVSHKLRFAGFVDERRKQALLANADLYVSTSQHEGFGLVYLEGMAAGLPVVCYDFGGQTDFLEDGVTGAVLPLNDEAAFAESCRAFIDSAELRAAAGQASLARVQDYFIDNCARRYEALFEEVIEARGSAA